MTCTWSFLAPPSAASREEVTVGKKSFAEVVSSVADVHLNMLPQGSIRGDSVSIHISQTEYELGISDCTRSLHSRLTLHKGDPPITTKSLYNKLSILWKGINNWRVIPLGKGYFEFNFNSIEDMHKIWSIGIVNLKPSLLRFYRWTKDFNPQNQKHTHSGLDQVNGSSHINKLHFLIFCSMNNKP